MTTDLDTVGYYKTSYFYAHVDGYRVTVAYKRALDRGSVVFGAAFCRPTDAFQKRMGRQIAEGRMNTIGQPILLDANMTRFDMHTAIIQSLISCHYCPENLTRSFSAV